MGSRIKAIIYAISAAIFYALNMPGSKLLLTKVPSTLMAAFLYLGAGIGIALLFVFNLNNIKKEELLDKKDAPYCIGMVLLDIMAPIFLMWGLKNTTSSTASLLNNFEIVATSLIALFIFKENISKRLWLTIVLVMLASMVLSVEDFSTLKLSWGTLLVLMATICWGFENNCTRSISHKNTFEIVAIKGLGSGLGSLIIALLLKEQMPHLEYVIMVLILGFIAYGLSITYYIKAQSVLGAAKTSAYYAIAPFVGAILSFVVLKEPFSTQYLCGLILMLIGSTLATIDTLKS